MKLEPARDVAARIVNTWPGGVPIQEWIDTLGELDEGAAGTAFVRLRNEAERAPTIAAFMRIYRSLHTSPLDPPGDRSCDHNRCAGDGWNTQHYIIPGRQDASGPVTYRGSIPCTCPTGQRNEKTWRTIRNSRKRNDEPTRQLELTTAQEF